MQKRRAIKICPKRVDAYLRELRKMLAQVDHAKLERQARGSRELTQQDRQDIQYHGATWNS
jgi:hypothetical protein